MTASMRIPMVAGRIPMVAGSETVIILFIMLMFSSSSFSNSGGEVGADLLSKIVV